MSLYQLASDFEKVVNGSIIIDDESGEIILDESNLDDLEMELDQKLENCGMFIKNEKAKANAIQEEIRHLQQRLKATKSKIDRMCSYVTTCMDIADKKDLETARVRLKFRRSTAVKIADDAVIPDSFLIIEKVEKPDKVLLKKALKAGGVIQGVELEERVNLQVD